MIFNECLTIKIVILDKNWCLFLFDCDSYDGQHLRLSHREVGEGVPQTGQMLNLTKKLNTNVCTATTHLSRLVLQWAKVIMSMERSIPPHKCKEYLEAYSITVGYMHQGVPGGLLHHSR